MTNLRFILNLPYIENWERQSTMTFFLISIKTRYPSTTIINDFSRKENNNFNLKFSADSRNSSLLEEENRSIRWKLITLVSNFSRGINRHRPFSFQIHLFANIENTRSFEINNGRALFNQRVLSPTIVNFSWSWPLNFLCFRVYARNSALEKRANVSFHGPRIVIESIFSFNCTGEIA